MFSGLNIAVMSLSVADLERKARLGNDMARQALPFRRNSHLTLAAILLGNVAAISSSSLVLEPHFNGLIAGALSTILIVIFGEVLPQALFAKQALVAVARLSWFLRLIIIVTYPLSKPLQLLLDRIIGCDEQQHLHSRHELGLIIAEHRIGEASELDEDEVDIIQGALQLSERRVEDIMQPIAHVYWLDEDSVLDAATVDDITARGYSRVPVFDYKLRHCRGVLLMKDMVDIDFDEKPVPVRHFRLYPTRAVGSRMALDTLLRQFSARHAHLLPVQKAERIVGIVTVEDLFEAIIGQEITDETDVRLDRE